MKLEIKLKDPRFCRKDGFGCPCWYGNDFNQEKTSMGCTLDYYINKWVKKPLMKLGDVRRPQKCIKENGK